MSWADKKLEVLQVGDRVSRKFIDDLEGEVVYVIGNCDKQNSVVINFSGIFLLLCNSDGSIPCYPPEYFFYIYERDGKPYPYPEKEPESEIDKIKKAFPSFDCFAVFQHMDVFLRKVWVYKSQYSQYDTTINSAPNRDGFVGYVYQTIGGTYEIIDTVSVSTIDGSLIFTTRQPLAVLFEKPEVKK